MPAKKAKSNNNETWWTRFWDWVLGPPERPDGFFHCYVCEKFIDYDFLGPGARWRWRPEETYLVYCRVCEACDKDEEEGAAQ